MLSIAFSSRRIMFGGTPCYDYHDFLLQSPMLLGMVCVGAYRLGCRCRSFLFTGFISGYWCRASVQF